MQELYKTILEEKLALLHSHVDAFKRHVEDHVRSTQTPDITTIWMEIHQLCNEITIVALAPLTISIPEITTEVLDLFTD